MVEVHSVAEAFLYCMVTPCPACGRGRLREQGELQRTEAAPGGWQLRVVCEACAQADVLDFSVEPPPSRESAASQVINPTAEPSKAIDLLGWLSLHRSILASTPKDADRQQMRELAVEAALCLDEALKFYEPENELPPAGAFFTDAGRQRFRDHPEQFTRSRWRAERLKLPDLRVRTEPERPRRRSFWRFWRRGD